MAAAAAAVAVWVGCGGGGQSNRSSVGVKTTSRFHQSINPQHAPVDPSTHKRTDRSMRYGLTVVRLPACCHCSPALSDADGGRRTTAKDADKQQLMYNPSGLPPRCSAPSHTRPLTGGALCVCARVCMCVWFGRVSMPRQQATHPKPKSPAHSHSIADHDFSGGGVVFRDRSIDRRRRTNQPHAPLVRHRIPPLSALAVACTCPILGLLGALHTSFCHTPHIILPCLGTFPAVAEIVQSRAVGRWRGGGAKSDRNLSGPRSQEPIDGGTLPVLRNLGRFDAKSVPMPLVWRRDAPLDSNRRSDPSLAWSFAAPTPLFLQCRHLAAAQGPQSKICSVRFLINVTKILGCKSQGLTRRFGKVLFKTLVWVRGAANGAGDGPGLRRPRAGWLV